MHILNYGTIKNAADILIVSYLIYRLLLMLKGTKAVQILEGIFVIFAAYILSNVFNLTTLHWILNNFISSIVLIIIIVFQQDIKRALAYMGKGYFGRTASHAGELRGSIEEVTDAVERLTETKTGALIVYERNIGIKEVINTGRTLDAVVTKELLLTIFDTHTPLHDGAVVIKGKRIIAAGCMLPLSQDVQYHPTYGTRHKAAFGLSAETDAVIIIVSEETGKVSIVADKTIAAYDPPGTIKPALLNYLGVAP
ncbi:MAG: diadenylate cyclase CdaA [Deltaproteobacteria bacterium]|nr:diadenylate cyclase CdaA [Deltaproteobacteria bacterium]MCL5277096.1 diadenylate cyclase CdaA [Deltaproteobacteria bacterium]